MIAQSFNNFPERLSVAKVLIENGLSIRERKIYCNNIQISTTEISRVAKVDRRTVTKTIDDIYNNSELKRIFQDLRSAGPSLKYIARHLNFGVVEITPQDARMHGILAKTTSLLSDRTISIRQTIVDDPELSPEPKLTLIAEKKIPGELISKFLEIKGVAKVSVF